MQEEYKKSIQKTLSAEDRAHKMDQLLAEEESIVQQLEKELSTKRDKKFNNTQQLHDIKREKQNYEAEIQVRRTKGLNICDSTIVEFKGRIT